MMPRARAAFFAVMAALLIAAARMPMPTSALDPAFQWRVLLEQAGCPRSRSHDLAVRIDRLMGNGPPADGAFVTSAPQLARQITHLAIGGHGLGLTPSQLDQALAILVGTGAAAHSATDAPAAGQMAPGPPTPSSLPPGQPFTTRHALELLGEWLPIPAPH